MPQPIDSTWAIKPEFLHSLNAMKDYPSLNDWEPQGYRIENGNVAVIEITGVLTRYSSMWQQMFGGAATDEVSKQFAKAMQDTNISAIVFDIDSPGGQVAGIPQLADQIFEARGKGKQIIAQCDGTLASAAYYIASQCDKVFASHSTDDIGSIGTVCCFYDYSKAFEKDGVEAVITASGPMKGLGIRGAPITEDQRAYLKEKIDQSTSEFLAAVQRGRGLSPESVSAVATGGTVRAGEAITQGLIDGVQPIDKTLAMLAGTNSKKKGRNMAGATYAEIKAECVGASADFIVQCLETGVELPQAKANWKAKTDQIHAETLADNAKLKADLTAAQASIATLTAEVAGLKKKPATFIPAGGTSTQATTTEDEGVSAKDQFFAKVNAEVATGLDRGQATIQAVRKYPEIHAAFLAEMKGAK